MNQTNCNPTSALNCISIILSRTSHPGNIGAAARAMKTMGLSRLILVAPRHFPDEEAATLACGAGDLLENAFVTPLLDDALAPMNFVAAVSARGRDLGPAAYAARQGAEELFARALQGEKVALLFGNESAGLSNDEIQRCHSIVTIEANPLYSSLNLASSVQVLAYELRMAALGFPKNERGGSNTADGQDDIFSRKKATPYHSPPATCEEQEKLFAHLERVMVGSGFLDPKRPMRLMPKLRRLFGRARLEKEEARLLRGILSAVELWKNGRD